uniref:RH1 domain-containing protein n=1 Tax=Paramormyrops kingsleyae TaxID=1676925 RepID=A0A3B3RB52_9TELE
MEFSESILCAAGDLELDPEIVSEEAGKVYSELQSVIEAHGPEAVEPLVPILVWVLEGLASCRAQLKESEEEAEREKGERKELLERFQSERALRKESQERYLELDDQFEQERRAMRGREKERGQRERELERKAREQADQLVALEEQKSILARDLSTLKHTHNKVSCPFPLFLKKERFKKPLTFSGLFPLLSCCTVTGTFWRGGGTRRGETALCLPEVPLAIQSLLKLQSCR